LNHRQNQLTRTDYFSLKQIDRNGPYDGICSFSHCAKTGHASILMFSGTGCRSIVNVRSISADEANAPFVLKGWNQPYDNGSQVRVFNTVREIQFVHVSTLDNPIGAFLVRIDQIAGMTVDQIRLHLALSKTPIQIPVVTVPSGTSMQVGRGR
jgi:hypothetical protein